MKRQSGRSRVLAYVISRVSGRQYTDFMREEVFMPLGMTHTSVYVGPRLEAYQAIRYQSDGRPIPFYYSDSPGAGAIYSSAHDLVRFGMFHLKTHLPDQKAILSDVTIDEIGSLAVPQDSITSTAAFGGKADVKNAGNRRF